MFFWLTWLFLAWLIHGLIPTRVQAEDLATVITASFFPFVALADTFWELDYFCSVVAAIVWALPYRAILLTS
jgi:hypothetical protein